MYLNRFVILKLQTITSYVKQNEPKYIITVITPGLQEHVVRVIVKKVD